MPHIRILLLLVTAFVLGTSINSFVALREHDWTGPEAIISACSALLLVAWLLSTRIGILRDTPRIRLLAVSLVLNGVLLCSVGYFALGVRQQEFWLSSRSQAALSLVSPRLLPPATIQVRPYSREPFPGYRVEACSWPGQTPGFIGGSYLTDGTAIKNVSLKTKNGEPVLVILFRRHQYNELSEFTRSHPGHSIAFVADNEKVLLDIPVCEPILEPYLRLTVSGPGLARLTAERFVLWFRRNPPLNVPGT